MVVNFFLSCIGMGVKKNYLVWIKLYVNILIIFFLIELYFLMMIRMFFIDVYFWKVMWGELKFYCLEGSSWYCIVFFMIFWYCEFLLIILRGFILCRRYFELSNGSCRYLNRCIVFCFFFFGLVVYYWNIEL